MAAAGRAAGRALKTKMVNDPMHGHCTLHPVLLSIIDTPQFQRLRDLKQLGAVYRVFPGASHNRFEHSLGVAHLARRLLEHLAMAQPDLAITPQEALTVQVAALTHDMGHGPLSHMFDNLLVPRVTGGRGHWAHEWGSVSMLHFLFNTCAHVRAAFKAADLTEGHIHMACEMILGSRGAAPPTWVWAGPPAGREFLFDIVSRKDTGVDVDKFDYIARDARQLNVACGFDADRLMRCTRALPVPGGAVRLCFATKEAWNVYELFHTRYNLHQRAYQHTAARAIEHMWVEALCAAHPHLRFPASDGTAVTMMGATQDMTAFTHVTDSVLLRIAASTEPELAGARALLRRVDTRDLYRCVHEQVLPAEWPVVPPADITELTAQLRAVANNTHVVVHNIIMNYGSGPHDPVAATYFYDCGVEGGRAYRVTRGGPPPSRLLPRVFQEQSLRVYCENRAAVPAVTAAVERVLPAWIAAHTTCDGAMQGGGKRRRVHVGAREGVAERAGRET